MMTEFIIEGVCVAKERPRKGNGGRFYTPVKTANYEYLVGWSYLSVPSYRRRKYEKETPVEVEIEIYSKVPVSWPKKKKQQALSQQLFPRKKDVDNQAKSILDGLNGVAYIDDCQVVKQTVLKQYAERDYVKVKIGEYKHGV